MKKFLKWFLIILGVIAGVIGILIFSFTQSMKPDKVEEEKVKEQAQKYLSEEYKGEAKIYDVLYDNMGNFPNFEYAAKVQHKDGTQFLVYFNDESQAMEDSYVSSKWENELEKEIKPYITKKLGKLDKLWILYDRRVGFELNIGHENIGSYREYEAKPTILISIPRKQKVEDEKLFQEIITYLKNEAGLKHAFVELNYTDNGVSLEDKIWTEEF